uniref:Uncharacterized protein n=1 Tax=Anguilla anguilla TaxID=7936 RepID=A0A0E9VJY2_ANGAN
MFTGAAGVSRVSGLRRDWDHQFVYSGNCSPGCKTATARPFGAFGPRTTGPGDYFSAVG